MPRAKKTDPKQDALNSLVSGEGEADDKTQTTVGSTAEDTTPTGDQAGTNEANPAEEPTADETGASEADTPEAEADPRDAALQGLISGSTPTGDDEPTPEAAPVEKTGRTVQLGSGKTRAVVAADMYTGVDSNGATVTAWKGDTVVLSAEKADRGVRLGLLTKA